MKISDLLEAPISARFDMKKAEQDVIKGPQSDYDGAFSKGRSHRVDPHQWRKTARLPIDDAELDPNYIWARISQQNQQNPYLPRINSLKVKTDSTGLERPQVDMETLFHETEFSPEVIAAVGDRIFPGFRYKVRSFQHAANVWTKLTEIIDDYIVGRATPKWITDLVDPQFDQVAKLLQHLKAKNSDWMWDIRQPNLMLRGTGTLPQLVIVDPFSSLDMQRRVLDLWLTQKPK